MADEVIIPIQADFTGFERQLAEEEARLERAFRQVPVLQQQGGLGNQIDYLNKLNQSTPEAVGRIFGTHPSVGAAVQRYNQAVAGPQHGPQLADAQKQGVQVQKDLVAAQKVALALQKQQNQQQAHSLRSAYGVYSVANQAAMFATGGRRMSASGFLSGALTLALHASTPTPSAALAAGTGTGGAASTAVSTVAQTAGQAAAGSLLDFAKGIGTKAAGLLGAIGVLGAIGLGANDLGSQVATSEQNLQASGVGVRGDTLFGRTLATSRGYLQNLPSTVQLYEQLGQAGVKGQNIEGSANAAIAFSRVTGIDTKTVGQLTGQLATGGQLSPDQIAQLFDAVVRGANVVGLSMTNLADNLTAFTKATGNTALGIRGQMSLLAVSGVLGNTISPTVAAPLQSAFGMQAFKVAGVLGIGVGQLQAMQGGQQGGIAALMDKYNQYLRKNTSGPLAQREEQAATINQALGSFYDTSGMGVSQQERLYGLALTGDPNKFSAAYTRLTHQVQPSAQDLRSTGRQVAQAETPLSQQLQITANSYLQQLSQDTAGMATDIHNMVTGAPANANQPGSSFWDVLGATATSFAHPFTGLPAQFVTDIRNLLDLFGGNAHAGAIAGINSVTGQPYQGGGGNGIPATGAPSAGGASYTPTHALNQTWVTQAQSLSKAVPSIPWQVFYAWQQAEGANPAYNNPLNIEYAPGDKNLSAYGEYNAFQSTGKGATAIGGFKTAAQGTAATASLLQNEYPGIMQAAQGGNVAAIIKAIENSSWAPGQYGTGVQSIFNGDFANAPQKVQVAVKVTVDDKRATATATVTGTRLESTSSHIGPATAVNTQRKPAGKPNYAKDPGRQAKNTR